MSDHSDAESDWQESPYWALWEIYHRDCPDLSPLRTRLVWFKEAESQQRLLEIGVGQLKAMQRAKDRIERLQVCQAPRSLISREISMLRQRFAVFQHAARLFRASRN